MRKLLLFLILSFYLSFAEQVSVNILNVENANIKDVAKLLAKITHRGILINPSVRGRITLKLKGELSEDDLWDIFSKAVAQLGYTVRYDKNRNLVIIEPTTTAKRLIHPMGKYSGEYSLLVVKLKHISPSVVYNSLRSFLSPYGRIYKVDTLNVLIISDFSGNLKFIEDFLKEVDKPIYTQTFKVYKLEHITADEFYQAVRPLIDWYRNQKRFPIYVATLSDKNIFVLSAPEELQEEIEHIKGKIDKPTKEDRLGFYILKLKYTSVNEVERTITNLFNKVKRKVGKIIFPSGLEITFDKTNNAILVFGSKKDFETFKQFVSLVDRRKKQVLITATIVEASDKKILDKGIRWQILGSNGGVAFGATSEQSLYQALSNGNFAIGTLSNSGIKVNIGGNTVFFPDLVFLYTLLEQGSGFHIISNPKVLTLDNQDAPIKVGQEVPFPTGIKYDVNGNPIITYDYKYVGLDLDVVPHVTGKNIRLVLKLKVQEITGYLTNNVGGINYSVPITSTRELNSDVIVQNGQTVIIGGLISQKSLVGTTKVPVLGDAPLIGTFFKSTHKENDKTNLFIFITPYVIDTPQDLAKIMEEHKKLAEALMKARKKEEKKVEAQKPEEVVLPYN